MESKIVLYDKKAIQSNLPIFRNHLQSDKVDCLNRLALIAKDFDGKVVPEFILIGSYLFIKEMFPELNIEDVRIAINLASGGQLGQIEVDKMSFGKRMLGKILSYYREYKRSQMSIFKKDEAERERQEKLKPIRKDEQYARTLHADCLFWVRTHNSVPLIADWNTIFEFLEKKGRINLTNDEKSIFAENVRASLLEECENYKIKFNCLDYQRIIDRMTNPKDFKTECRKKYLQNVYYSRFIKN